MAPHKLHLVPNGTDPAEWLADAQELPPALDRFLSEQRAAGKFIVGYAGSHNLSNAMGTLVEAAPLVRNAPVVFVLVGDGNDKRALMEKARALGASNLHFFDPIPKRQIPALLRRFDVAYVGWLRHPLYRFGVFPNKLIDYMMAGRPILHSVEAGNDPVADANCGLTVIPENPGAVADGVLALLAHGQAERDAMGQRGRSYALANLTYPVLGQRFLAALAGEAHHG